MRLAELNATDRLDLLRCLWTVLRPAEAPHVHPAEYPRLRRLEARLQRAEYEARETPGAQLAHDAERARERRRNE